MANLADQASAAVDSVLDSLWTRQPAVVVSAPPGSGKTGLIERLAACGGVLAEERVAVATTTRAQMTDVARRTSAAYPSLEVTLLASRDMEIPADIKARDNVAVVRRPAELPQSPGMVIATAAKWGWVPADHQFDVLLVDEAFQLSDAAFAHFAHLGNRAILVGDPGQIDPVVKVDTRRWNGRADGPHIAAPKALLARHPEAVTHIRLPATRRLPEDTVGIIGQAFYPDLPFHSLQRYTGVRSGATGVLGEIVQEQTSLTQLVLNGRADGINDAGMADALVELARSAVGSIEIETPGGWRAVTSSDIAIVCAHVSQVAAVQSRLMASGLGDVLCDTTERVQGLERAVVLVWHPISGRRDATEFALDAGRLCVMLSRHTHMSVLVTRPGVADVYAAASGVGERAFGDDALDGYRGWRSHVELLEEMDRRGRILHQ